MTEEEIKNHLDGYPGRGSEGNLHAYSKVKYKERKFKGASLWYVVERELFCYYDEMNHDQFLAEEARVYVVHNVQKSIEIVKIELAKLTKATTPNTESPLIRLNNKAKKIERDFIAFEES